jgi:5-oxopent-3-ene-1,2,5-tricarboxylate decarboxylase / 2-hydroxyhepta-2,4-diene-1,7-dioate isomerase
MAPIRYPSSVADAALAGGVTTWPVAGRNTIYGVALNYRTTLEALGTALYEKPYGAPPKAPVLYIKPPNTWVAEGDPIIVPADITGVQAGVTLAAVLKRDLYQATAETVLDALAGFTIVNDVTIPHSDFFRPMIQNRCRDSFCAIGTPLARAGAFPSLERIEMRVWVNGELRCTETTAGLVRPVAQLLADISALFTLSAGDLVLIGTPPNSPVVKPGDQIRMEIDGIGSLSNPVLAATAGVP